VGREEGHLVHQAPPGPPRLSPRLLGADDDLSRLEAAPDERSAPLDDRDGTAPAAVRRDRLAERKDVRGPIDPAKASIELAHVGVGHEDEIHGRILWQAVGARGATDGGADRSEIARGIARDRDAHFEFWQYLVRDGSEGQALGALHELGVLGALFPEIGRLRARAQHSLYHVYTVDTHTVFALQRLMRLRAGALADVEPELTRIARAQQRPLVLMLGLLFHDLGKGLGPDHSARGAELVRAYAQRVALDPADAADVEWLVLAHLKMSHLSQRRDLEDMALIEAFARELRTVERLQMLYLLTYADMASVSAENWTDWKSRLLRLLYEKAHATLLAEGLDGPEHEHTLELRRERLASALAPLVGDDAAARSAVSEFAQALPERYASIVPPADAARHLKLWLVAKKSGFSAELRQSQSGGAELTLVAPDRPGLLAVFSAALAANGIDILAAEVNSLEDGIALDQFIVREPGGGAPAPGRWNAAHADLLRLRASA